MADWKFVSHERNGDQAGELTDLQGVSMSFFLNRPATIAAQLRIESTYASPTYIAPGRTEIKAYRDTFLLQEAFRISSLEVSSDAASTTVGVQGDGLMSYLQDLLAYKAANYSSTAQSTIAWNWINTAQTRAGGSYGITRGEIPASDPTKSVAIEEDTELLEAIVNLSERDDGFDFAVDAARRFNVYYPQRGRTTDVVFDSSVNVVNWQVAEDAGPGSVVTDARIRGGPGSSVQSASDTAARTTYGRREASIQYSGVIDDNTVLSSYASRVVDDRSEPLLVPTLTLDADHPSIPWGSYWIGDTVQVRLRAGSLVNLDRSYRIVALHVRLDAADNEEIQVELNPA